MKRQQVHTDQHPPIEYQEALRSWDEVKRKQGAPTLKMNPAHYDSVGKVRRRQGQRVCLTCGGAKFIRFTWPIEHPYFGRPVRCPTCNA